MARPKKAKTLDRRVSVRLNEQTYAAYERVAAAFDIPVGQLLRQVLALEVQELELVVAALQRHARGERFATLPAPLTISQQELIANIRETNTATGGGLTARLRAEAARQQGSARPMLTPAPETSESTGAWAKRERSVNEA